MGARKASDRRFDRVAHGSRIDWPGRILMPIEIQMPTYSGPRRITSVVIKRAGIEIAANGSRKAVAGRRGIRE